MLRIIIILLTVMLYNISSYGQNFTSAAMPDENNNLHLYIRSYCTGNIQWQVSPTFDDDWQNIPGATFNKYPIEAIPENISEKKYRASITMSPNPDLVYSYPFSLRVIEEVSDIQIGDLYDGTFVYYNSGDTTLGTYFADSVKVRPSCDFLNSISYVNSSEIGGGLKNTEEIIMQCGDIGNAANVCYNLELNDHTDWFLPSEKELQHSITMLRNHGIHNIQSKFYGNYYIGGPLSYSRRFWSSTHRLNFWGESVVSMCSSNGQGDYYYHTSSLEDYNHFDVLPSRYITSSATSLCETFFLQRRFNNIQILETENSAIVEISYVGEAIENSSFEWDFDKGNVLNGSGVGPYEVEFAFGGYNEVSLKISSDNCEEDVQFSNPFQVDLLSKSSTLFPGIYDGSISAIDINDDGYLDVFLSGKDTISIYLNKLGGEFELLNTMLPILSESHSSWGDFDNDGDIDLLFSGYNMEEMSPKTYIFENKSGEFSEVAHNLKDLSGGFCEWIDINNDGKLDIILSGIDKDSIKSTRLYHNENGEYIEKSTNFPSVTNSSISIEDRDKNNYLDFIILGITDSVRITEIYNNNQGDFVKDSIDLVGVEHGDARFLDINHDGLLDLYYVGNIKKIQPEINNLGHFYASVLGKLYGAYYLRQEDGKLEEWNNPLERKALIGFAFSGMDSGDFDNDGIIDIAVTGTPAMAWTTSGIGQTPSLDNWIKRSKPSIVKNHINGLAIIEPDIPGSWSCCSNPESSVASKGGYRPSIPLNFESSKIQFADFNNDGRLDILREGNGDGYASAVYFNNLSVENQPPSVPDNPRIENISCDTIRLLWDESIDDHTPQHGITYEFFLGTAPDKCDIFSKLNNRRLRNTYFTVSGLEDGTYYWGVKATDNGKRSSAYSSIQSFEVKCNTDIKELKIENIKVYPNPFNAYIVIAAENSTQFYHYQITNSLGQNITRGKGKGSTIIETSNFESGIFFLTVSNGTSEQMRTIIRIP